MSGQTFSRLRLGSAVAASPGQLHGARQPAAIAGRHTTVAVSAWATALAVSVIALLLPTGSDTSQVYWNVALLVGGAYALLRLAQDVWPLLRLDALTVFLSANALLAGAQLATGNTASPFLTLNVLQFWCGSLLLLPLFNEGIAIRLAGGRRMTGLVVLLLAVFLTALVSGLQDTFRASNTNGPALWWPFLYRNHLAAFVVLVLPVLLWRFHQDARGRWLALAAGIAGVAAVVASGSRGGTALVAAECGICGFLFGRARSLVSRLVPPTAVLASVGLLAALGGTAMVEYRLHNWSPLVEGRIDYWRASLAMISERPLTGWGFGTWPDVYRQFMVYDSGLVVNRAHSDWLEWTAEGGMSIAAALCWLLWGALRRAWITPWAWGMPLLLAYGMVDYTLRAPLVWVAFLTLWMASEGSNTPIGSPTAWQGYSPGSCGSARGDGTAISCAEGVSRD